MIKIRQKAQTILEIKRRTTTQVNKFISKFMPSNLINEMDNCLRKCKLPKCTKKETENMNGPININNLITSQNQPLHKKEQRQDVFIRLSPPTFSWKISNIHTLK